MNLRWSHKCVAREAVWEGVEDCGHEGGVRGPGGGASLHLFLGLHLCFSNYVAKEVICVWISLVGIIGEQLAIV